MNKKNSYNKKHILFIVENSTLPFDPRVWSEALVAKEMGYVVSVICPKNRIAPDKYENINGINIYRHFIITYKKSRLGFLLEYLNALFCELYLSVKIYIKKPFKLIHTANPPDFIFLIAILFKPFGVKFIFDHHDLSPELFLLKFANANNFLYRILLIFERISCKIADVVISSNQSYKNIIIQRHNIMEKKIFIVRNDPHLNEEFPIVKKKNRYINILYVGKINKQDGVELLVRSINYLVYNLKKKNFICIILGSGESLVNVKNLAVSMNLRKYIVFKGYIYDRNRLKEYLSSADICVESAPKNKLNEHSTFIKIMEYMAAGKPIVAFDLPETRYSTKDSAILVKTGNIEEYAKAIKILMENPQLRKKLGKTGRKRIETELNWSKSSLNLKKAYMLIESLN